MADPDRRTSIDGDQITDHTIRPEELDTTDQVKNPKRWQLLAFDQDNNKMKWFYDFGNRIMR